MKIHKFARKPFYVDAVRVSETNLEEVAQWCQGEVLTDEDEKSLTFGQRYIKVSVHRPLTEDQTRAYVGKWVLFAGTGFKVYTPKAFDKSFEKVRTLTKAQADEAGIKVPHEPKRGGGAIPRSTPNPGTVGKVLQEAFDKMKPKVEEPKVEEPKVEEPKVENKSFDLEQEIEKMLERGDIKSSVEG